MRTIKMLSSDIWQGIKAFFRRFYFEQLSGAIIIIPCVYFDYKKRTFEIGFLNRTFCISYAKRNNN